MSGVTARPPRGPFVPFTQRIVSALLLRRELYNYAATDPTALSQALAIVCFAGLVQPWVLTREFGAWGMLISLLFGVVRWLVFATLVAYPIARLITWKPVPYRRLLSCLGFAEAPTFLNVLAFTSKEELPWWFRAGVWFWLLAANVVAMREALSVTLMRAIGIAVTCFVVYLGIGLLSDVLLIMPP